MILGLKLGRRLVGVVGLDDERVTFHDARFVRAKRGEAGQPMGRYLARVLDQTHPQAIALYAPPAPGAITTELVGVLERLAASTGTAVTPITKRDLFGSFGLSLMRTRADLVAQVATLWPGLQEVASHRQETVAEAAAAALIGDLRHRWPLR